MDRPSQERPAAVPKAKQAGETPGQWGWVEGAAWTPRMLAALEQGVKGGKWFSLIDKVFAQGNLRSAFAKVKANKGAAGVDHQTIEAFEHRLEENLALLSLSAKPLAVNRFPVIGPG